MKDIVIALDGYSGTGKSSTAQQVAKKLGYIYIDSGAMYRAVTYFLIQKNADLNDLRLIEKLLDDCRLEFRQENIYLNGENVESEIRTMQVNEKVSTVSAISAVRQKLVEQQRILGKNKAVVMDGRDIGTVVFPNAELKLFMTANMEVRTERRKKQLESKGIIESEDNIRKNLLERDRKDSARSDSPLRKAEDAKEIDTSDLTLNEQIEKIVSMANEIINED